MDIIKYLQICLKDQYLLDVARNGNEGWEQAIEVIPDVIISDVMMPEMDGFDLCSKLKTDMRTSHIPIILLTAKADRTSKLEGLEIGADAYLTKPFDRTELLIRLTKMIELRRSLQHRLASNDQQTDGSNNLENEFLVRVDAILEQHLDNENFRITDLCSSLGISRVQLHRKLKALTNHSTSIYIRRFKLTRATKLLESSNMTIAEVAYAVGFKNPAYFTQVFTELHGFPPSTLR